MNEPSAESILSLLVDLLADQYQVEVKYHIEKGGEGDAVDG